MRHRADGKLTCVEKGETLIQFIIKTIIMIRQSLSVSDLFCWTLFKACNDLLFFCFEVALEDSSQPTVKFLMSVVRGMLLRKV